MAIVKSLYSKFTPADPGSSLQDLFVKADLDFPVGPWKLTATGSYTPEDGIPVEQTVGIESDVASVRLDTGQIFKVVGADYGFVPYPEAFSIVDPIIEDGYAHVEGAKSINSGQRAYVWLRGEGCLNLGGDDKIENHFALRASHDGSTSVEATLTPVRVVDGTVSPIGRTIKRKHSKNASNNLIIAKSTIRDLKKEWESYSEAVKALVQIKLTDEEAIDFVDSVLGEAKSPRAENIRDKVYATYKGGVGAKFPASHDTLFGIMQAIMFWCDNVKTVRTPKRGDLESAAIDGKLSGPSAKQKSKAYEIACKKAKSLGAVLKLQGR